MYLKKKTVQKHQKNLEAMANFIKSKKSVPTKRKKGQKWPLT